MLVGYDAHKLIFHSLYHGIICFCIVGFVDDKLEHHTIFSEPELVKVVEYEWDPEFKHHQLVGLGKH